MMRKPVSLIKTNNHGGKRAGAGRKAIYPNGTRRIYVPIELIPDIMAMIDRFIRLNPTDGTGK